MTNKEYKMARIEHEGAAEIYTFEHYNGVSWYPNRYMTGDDIKEMRREYKEIKADCKAFALDNFGGRALIIPTDNGYTLQSYYTNVARIDNEGNFYKLWQGFSVTTLKHINGFRTWAGMRTLSKREWIELALEVK